MIAFLEHILMVGTGSSFLIAFFLAAVFMRQKRKHPQTNLVMGLLLITLACSLAMNAWLEAVMHRDFTYLRTLPEPFLLLIGPLFYEYIHRISGSRRSLSQALVHLPPFLVVAGGLLALLTGGVRWQPETLVHAVAITWLAIYIQFWVYAYLNHRLLKQYKNGLKAIRSSIEGVYPHWISYCLAALFLCYSLLGVLFLLQHRQIFLPINRSLSLVLAVIIYCIGYRILVRPDQFTLPPIEPRDALHPEKEKPPRKYRKSGLDNQRASLEIARVLEFMTSQKPHLDPELDLKKLAHMLQLSPHHLSQLLNTERNASFYDFVNGYRVHEAQRLLVDEANQKLTLIHLGLEAGFQSKATFNRVFKKVTGQTPSQYRRANLTA